MSETQKFQHIVNGIREDLTFIENLHAMLDLNLGFNQGLRSSFSHVYEKTAMEIKQWINDVFLDKIYEINSKVLKFLTDVSCGESGLWKVPSTQEIERYMRDILQEKKLGYGNTFSNLERLKRAINGYRESIETTLNDVRKFFYETSWTSMKKINLEDYILLTKRRKYITAREELENAKKTFKDGKPENVLNFIRSAIELAIKERFGFTRFKNFWEFLVFADNSDFPLPSYDMLYFYFSESSGRLHAGRLHTPLECQSALEFVNGFIDRLELINISQEKIDNFKKECKWVE